jgi:branched-chain amino acid transport system permease protein
LALPSILFFGVDVVSFLVSLGILFCLFLVISLTLNLEFGYTGIPNFGKAMFVAAGGALGGAFSYRFAVWLMNVATHGDDITNNFIIANQINTSLANSVWLSLGILLITLTFAAGVGAAFGYFASYPAIRLREDYLGMLLLASGEFFRIFLVSYYPLIGGSLGIELPDVFAWSSSLIGLRDVVALGAFATLALLVYIYSERVARSPLARMLRAIRENENASAALGKDNVLARKKVLVIASALCAVAGALYSMYLAHVDPDQFERGVYTFWPWVMVILGGAGSNKGVAVGAAVFVGINNLITQYAVSIQSTGGSVFLPIGLNRLQPMVFGILLIIVLLMRPSGIIKEKPTSTISRSKLAAITGALKGQGGIGPPSEGTGKVKKVLHRLRDIVRRKPKET